MEYHITDNEAKDINVDFVFKLDTLSNHLDECISTITPLIDVLSHFKHLYEPQSIEDYYSRLKRKYESNRCAWINRGELWQIN